MNLDEQYMRRALELAKKGLGYTNPNPMVGAVIVKCGKIIGEGYHECYGQLHAERNALKHCSEDPSGATLYVTLEPCCHYGKTPPCTEAIIEHGIAKVVVGSLDPNPKVAGKGIQILKEHGIEVETGVLEEECLQLNEVFFYHIQTKLPYVVLKYAMTLDGKIATSLGESKWITNEESRKHVQQLRHQYAAIMVGIGTVLEDDPMLTARIENANHPTRVICDTHLRIPLDSKIVQTACDIPTIIMTSVRTKKAQSLEEMGCNVIVVGKDHDHVDLKEVFQVLGQQKIDSVLIEGGGTLNEAVLKNGNIQKVYAYIAPKLLGGKQAKTPIEGEGIMRIKDAVCFTPRRIHTFGEDILLEYKGR